MKLDLSKIKFSNNDIRKNVQIPDTLTPKLAEFIGIMVGDGHVGVYKNHSRKRTLSNFDIRISGNLKDYNYYSEYVNNLTSELFNLKFYVIIPKNENSLMLYKNSKALYHLLSELMNIPPRKDNITIPEKILNSSVEIKSWFLRGLADADFTFTLKNREGKLYPVVQGVSKSENLIKGVSSILKQLNINHFMCLDKSYYAKRNKTYVVTRLYINGFRNVGNWFDLIGFSNPRHTQRWKEFCDNKRAGRDSNTRQKSICSITPSA